MISSVLSLKRNRSTGKKQTDEEPVKKLTKLKSSFSIFSKLSDVIKNHNKDEQEDKKKTPFLGFLQHFRSNETDGIPTIKKPLLRRKATYLSDGYFEYYQYHKKQQENSQQKNEERNIHTLPTRNSQTKKLTSILIKRSNPTDHNDSDFLSSSYMLYDATVNSEDLTAKEFADIAGIRILPEDEEEEEEDLDQCIIEPSQQRFSYMSEEDINIRTVGTYSNKSDMNYSIDEGLSLASHKTSHSRSLSTSSINKPKIWENEFWLNPDSQQQQQQQQQQQKFISRSNSAVTHHSKKSILQHSHHNQALHRSQSQQQTKNYMNEPPILNELRRMNTQHSENKNTFDQENNSNYCVIKKGRFEIQLGG